VTGLSAALAGFAAASASGTLPDPVVASTKRLLLDALASGMVGWSAADATRIRDTAAGTFGPGDATVIAGAALSPAGAALTNGYLITARSLCDVHRPTLSHVTPVVVPAAIAAAERGGATGSRLIAALATGIETVVRVGTALRYPEFRRRGWHTPGVAGPLGAAVAAAVASGGDAATINRALGLAGAQSGGTFASFGTPAIKFHQARAAVAGLVAADLAATGFTAAADIIGAGDGGLLNAFSDGGLPEAITDGLGETWHLDEISTRRWPAAAALQALIGVLLDNPLPPEEITEVHLRLPSDAHAMHATTGWDTPFEATLSARWVAAVVITDGECWLDQFAPERILDSRVARLASRVMVTADRSLGDGTARITVTGAGGTLLETVAPDRGPASWDETVAKLHAAAVGVVPPDAAERLAAAVERLEAAPDVGDLVAPLRR
jgi:2-methylcitrate dehydratase PrpD